MSAQPWWACARGAAALALDLVVPQECAGCRAPGRAWCPACAATAPGAPLQVPGPVPCRSAAPHGGAVGRGVVALKENGQHQLATPLGGLLAGAIQQVVADVGVAPGTPVWLVPVPARRAARRQRGADHVAALCGRAARVLRARGVPAHRCTALRHVAESRDQVGLGARDRRANVTGTLAGLWVPEGAVVVCDDVTTTGATLAEAVRALTAVGRRPVAAATLTWSARLAHLA